MSSEHEEQEGLQMSFLDHLDELRRRLIYAVVTIAVAFTVCFYFSDYIFNFLAVPVKKELRKIRIEQQEKNNGRLKIEGFKEGEPSQYTFVQETAVNGVKVPLGTTIHVKLIRDKDNKLMLALAEPWSVGNTILDAGKSVGDIIESGRTQVPYDENDQLIINTVGGAFALYMHIALYAGIAFAIPFLLYQVWAFIAPGLYKHEKRYVVPVLTMTTVFFILGAAFAYTVAFPAACNYLLGLQESGGFRTLINAEDFFDLIIMIMIGLGIVFQIPTISFLLARIGLLTPRIMWRWWRHAVVVIAILAAVLTPTADAFNMIVFALPMLMLYFLSIGIVWFFGKARKSDEDVTALATTK
jgi:sec-independent protein translocase protein TatC